MSDLATLSSREEATARGGGHGLAALLRRPRGVPQVVRREGWGGQHERAHLAPRAEPVHLPLEGVEATHALILRTAVASAAGPLLPAVERLDLIAPVVKVPQMRVCTGPGTSRGG